MPFNTEKIKNDLLSLKGPVFTIYLKTDPANENWKIRLKNGLKRIEHFVNSSQPENVKLFSKLRKKVDLLMKDNQRNFKQGLICFVTEEDTLFYLLQVPVENEFRWEDEPATDQLDKIIEKHPKSGILLLQKEHVSILETNLGELTGETHYELDLSQENWKQYKGLAYGSIISSSANHRDKFNRRVRENQARWFKNLIPTINKHIKRGEWKGVYLTGATELTNIMEDELNRRILGVVNSDYSGRTSHEIVNKVFNSLE